MSNKLPFEDAFERQMNDLPVPDAEASWQKMEHLLDDKDRRRPVVVYKRLATVMVAALLVLAAGWYLLSNPENDGTASKARTQNTAPSKAEPVINDTKSRKEPAATTADKNNSNPPDELVNEEVAKNLKGSVKKKNPFMAQTRDHIAPGINRKKDYNQDTSGEEHLEVIGTKRKSVTDDLAERRLNRRGDKTVLVSGQKESNKTGLIAEKDSNNIATSKTNTTTSSNNNVPSNSIGINPTTLELALVDSSTFPTSAEVKQASAVSIKKTQAAKYIVSAGIGVQQQIPVNGQQRVAIGYNGRSAVADYIPSIFVRLENPGRWFLQTEFIYANPQLVDQFSYFRQTRLDSLSLSTTSYQLQKTFYTDIPLTFNYYVARGWSVGAGGMYGWLNGAVAEKETNTTNLQTQQLTTTSETKSIRGYTDSFLYKSHTYLLLQSEYKWKNLSLGLRFARDMQPYIRYTMPNGVVADKRNWSLDLMLRLHLFKLKS